MSGRDGEGGEVRSGADSGSGSHAGGDDGGKAIGGTAGDANAAGEGASGPGGSGTAGTAGTAGTEAGGEAGAATGSIEVRDFADYQVIQRDLASHSQRVRVEGTFEGRSITLVEGQVVSFAMSAAVVVPWTELAVTSAGVYEGSLDVREGGWYRIVVRGRDDGGREVARTTGARRWGVGMNILCIGQSNMVGYGGSSYTPAGDLASLYGNDGNWKHLTDPYDRGGTMTDVDFDAGSGASLVPSLANALTAQFPGMPVGVIPAAKGSSPLACVADEACWGRRNAVTPADPSNLYGNSVAKARAVGGVELVVMQQGETDATNSVSTATYASELSLLAGNYRTDLGNVPLFMCQLGRSTTDVAIKGRTDATMQAIRVAQNQADAPPRVYLAATAIDLDVDATDHYKKGALDELGRRIAGAIGYHYQTPSAPEAYRGPHIESVSYADASRTLIDVHVTHRGGNDLTPTTDINGFVVLDGTTSVPLTSAVRRDATTLRLTLQSAIQGVGAVRYLYGKLPFQTLTNSVHDDSSLSLPLEPTVADLLLP